MNVVTNITIKLSVKLFVIFFLLGCQSVTKKTPTYQLRPFKEVTLSNGLPVLLVPDRTLPYFQMILTIQSGNSSEPERKLGLSRLTASLLDKGTKQRSATAIAKSLEQLGNYFYVSSSWDLTELVGGGLSFHKDKLLKDFSEVLLQPIFPEREVKDQKDVMLASLAKTVDYPGVLINAATKLYLYGSHPYSRRSLGRRQDVQNITRSDILLFYKKHYTPQNARLAIIGDFDDQILFQLENHLGGWTGSKPEPVKYPGFPRIAGVQILLIDRPEAKQTEIRLAHKGIKRSNPDFLTLKVVNTILGEDSSSRLNREIRKKRGLTYHISSSMGSQKDFSPFFILTATRHDKVGEVIRETLNILKKYIEDGVTDDELTITKSSIKGRLPRVLETAESFAQNLLHLRFHGVPETYLTNFYSHLEHISQSDVNQAIKKYLSAENIKIIIYGPKEPIIEQVRPIGVVETMSYKEFL